MNFKKSKIKIKKFNIKRLKLIYKNNQIQTNKPLQVEIQQNQLKNERILKKKERRKKTLIWQ